MDAPPAPQPTTPAFTPPYTPQPEDVIEESKALAVRLAQVGGAVVGLSGVAFSLGWLHWYSYLSGFRAEWLMTYIPTRSLLVSSVFPLLSVLAFSAASIVRRVSPETAPRFWKRLLWALLVAFLVGLAIRQFFPEASPWGARLYALWFAAMAGDSVSHMVAVLAVRGAPRGRLIPFAVGNAVMAMVGLFCIPWITSEGEAKRDRNPRRTSLPRLALVQSVIPSASPEYVLVANDTVVFTVPLPLPTAPVPVRCYPLSSVREVRLP